jgi:hypothetical protein
MIVGYRGDGNDPENDILLIQIQSDAGKSTYNL